MARQVINTGSALNDPSAENIRDAFTKVNAMSTELYTHREHNVLDYGALGNASYADATIGADDTAEIQAAIDAAIAPGGSGRVIIPGNRTYKISSSLVVYGGMTVAGIGGRNGQGNYSLPTIGWNGNGTDPIMKLVATTQNVPNFRLENINLASMTGAAFASTCGFKFTSTGGAFGSTDTGCDFHNVWMQVINGNALWFDGGGATNFRMSGGRFDAIYGGYAIYVDLTREDSGFLGTITDGVNYVGGGAVQGNGFMFLDSEGNTSGHSHILIDGLHTEINQSLVETFATGAQPYDRRGIIRLGVTPGGSPPQHRLLINSWFNAVPGGVASFSCIHVTAATGTTEQAAENISLDISQGNALNTIITDTNTTDEIRLIGGHFPVARRYPHPGGRVQQYNYAYGKDSTYESFRAYSAMRDGTDIVYGRTYQPRLVASLAPFPGMAGALACVTDATVTTRYSVVAGGGENKVMVFYDGTNWLIL